MNRTATRLYNEVEGLFKGRPELIHNKPEDFTGLARALAFRGFNGSQDEIPIAEKLEGSESGRDILRKAHAEFKDYASQLFLLPEKRLEIADSRIMATGSTQPLKVNFKVLNTPNPDTERTVYIKRQDPIRLAGLELYRTVGNLAQDYNFVFNQQGIVEQEITGTHIDLTKNRPISERLVRDRIKLDAVAFFLGLDDISKPANTIVTPNNRVILIDHDTFDREYSPEDIIREQRSTANDLGISVEDYNRIFNEEVHLLNHRVRANKDRLERLSGVLIDSNDSILSGVGRYITRNIYNALQEGPQ